MRRAAAFLVFIAAPATAQEQKLQGPGPVATSAASADAFDALALDGDALSAVAGRENIGALIAQADQRNTVAGNSVTGNSVTGSVAIDGQAFQNIQGMAVVSANSGNNVAMNAAMNVTINVSPR